MTRPVRARESGLTLVEVLVALVIFAIIGVAGMSILTTTVRVKQSTEGRLERLASIDRAILVMGRDLLQMIPGGVVLDDQAFGFDRAGEEAPEPVTYLVSDATLLRRLETRAGSVDQRLLDNVEAVGWRLMTGTQQWREAWPRGADVPVAAEVTLTLRLTEAEEMTDITRLFALPASAAR